MATGTITKVMPTGDANSYGTYLKLPDGTLIQWGSSGQYASGNNRTDEITFPIAFKDSTIWVFANGWFNGSDVTNYNVTCIVARVSATKCKINIHNATAAYTNMIFWFAIGRWK